MKPTALTILAFAAALAPANAAEGDTPTEQSRDFLVVTVDDTEIRMSDIAARFQQKSGRPLSSLTEEENAEFMASGANQVTEELVAEMLLAKEAGKEGIVVSPDAIAEAEAKVMESIPEGMTAEEYYRVVGTTPEEMRKTIGRNLRIQKLVEKTTADIPAPSEEEVRAFYDENPASFDVGERVRARHILFNTQELSDEAAIAEKLAEAKAVRERLVGDDAEDFATVAKEESEGPSAPQGGDLGEFGPGDMVPQFDAVVFSMEPGDVSEPVKTDFGYHLIKLESKTEPGTVPFDEAKGQIADYLKFQEQWRVVQGLVARLKSEASIVSPQPQE